MDMLVPFSTLNLEKRWRDLTRKKSQQSDDASHEKSMSDTLKHVKYAIEACIVVTMRSKFMLRQVDEMLGHEWSFWMTWMLFFSILGFDYLVCSHIIHYLDSKKSDISSVHEREKTIKLLGHLEDDVCDLRKQMKKIRKRCEKHGCPIGLLRYREQSPWKADPANRYYPHILASPPIEIYYELVFYLHNAGHLLEGPDANGTTKEIREANAWRSFQKTMERLTSECNDEVDERLKTISKDIKEVLDISALTKVGIPVVVCLNSTHETVGSGAVFWDKVNVLDEPWSNMQIQRFDPGDPIYECYIECKTEIQKYFEELEDEKSDEKRWELAKTKFLSQGKRIWPHTLSHEGEICVAFEVCTGRFKSPCRSCSALYNWSTPKLLNDNDFTTSNKQMPCGQSDWRKIKTLKAKTTCAEAICHKATLMKLIPPDDVFVYPLRSAENMAALSKYPWLSAFFWKMTRPQV